MSREEQRLRLIRGTNRRASVTRSPVHADTRGSTPPDDGRSPCSDLAQALRASEQRLRALLDDRGRIGRDLHDCVLQSLYAIGLALEQSRRVNPATSRSSRSSSLEIVDQLNALIQDIRRMISGLERGTVEGFDLPSELRGLVKTYTQIGGMHIALELQPSAVEILTGEEEREILNIVREALSNSARHARATHASIVLQTRGTRVRLAIDDNGIGFETDRQRPGGYGLANMAARAKKLGGHLTIRSHPGRGTKVIAEFSLDPVLSSV